MTIKIEFQDDEALVLLDLVETLKSFARHLSLERVDTYVLEQLQTSLELALDTGHSPIHPERVLQARKAVGFSIS